MVAQVSGLMDLIGNPLVWKILLSYWIFSAAVGALPTPTADSHPAYQFLFRFAHGLSGNLNRAALSFKVPGAPDPAAADPKP